MSSRSEPPLSGWKLDPERHSLQKSFHFSSKEPMKDFCLSILTNNHDTATNLAAIECHDTHDIKVELFSRKSFQNETFDIIRTIESCYQQTQKEQSDVRKNHDSVWSRWFKGFSQ